ncbi:MAG TPA: hypothetical protein PLO63_11615 [Syntrophales bacterium]|nr:hypothetical protein [Syntrophales bacterium]
MKKDNDNYFECMLQMSGSETIEMVEKIIQSGDELGIKMVKTNVIVAMHRLGIQINKTNIHSDTNNNNGQFKNRDILINRQVLWEEIGPLIDELDTELWWALRHSKRYSEESWLDENVRLRIRWTIDKIKDANNIIQKIISVFERTHKIREKASVNRDKKRIEHLSIIYGGMNKPTSSRKDDCFLSDKFLLWKEKQGERPDGGH